ncbi:MAG: CRISPR-associated protein Cas4 [Nitrososphaeria archaeon]
MKSIRLPDGRRITGTLVWYYFICQREVWLMGRELTPDEDDEILKIGRAIHSVYYRDMKDEVQLDGIKVDRIRGRVIYEIKTSSKYLEATKFQLLYYIYRFRDEGVDVEGEILIPKEGKRIKVDKADISKLETVLQKISEIVRMEKPPLPQKIPFCRKCAYRNFCWC